MAGQSSDKRFRFAAKNVLCVRLDAMGDLLMTTPAFRALKESEPRRTITVLTSSGAAPAAALVPEIDQVVIYDAPWMKASSLHPDAHADLELIGTIRRNRFDAAVIFTVFSQNPLPAALLAFYAEIPLRLAHCRENPYQLLTHWVKDTEPETGIRHEVQRQLDLVAAVGARTPDQRLSLAVPSESRVKVEALLRSCGLGLSDAWYVLHPGASAASRRYPAESFAAAARLLYALCGYRAVVTGSRAERDLVCEVVERSNTPALPFSGVLSLAEFAALLEFSPLVISNNTGPVHVAAALGTPVVDLYALTNPQHTPWGTEHRVLSHDVPCRNCFKSVCPEAHHACLRTISPEQVAACAMELLHPAPAKQIFQEQGGLTDVDARN